MMPCFGPRFSPGPGSICERRWHYWRPAAADIVEAGTVRGLDVALPTHFHMEDQVTVVLSGRRRFVIGSELIETVAGRAVRIPAGTPHRSLAEASNVFCINLYTPPGLSEAFPLVELIRSCDGHRSDERLGDGPALDQFAHRFRDPITWTGADQSSGTVGEAALRAGMSREGYSRKFKKLHGIAPRDFRLLDRLNHARRLLRLGEPIGAAAAEAGFSDQSHLGRCFRRFFGVTPGEYRTGGEVTSVL